MDVDDEADLRLLAREDLSGTKTGAWLHRSGLLARLLQAKIGDNPVNLAASI
jgi:hypothetical protein